MTFARTAWTAAVRLSTPLVLPYLARRARRQARSHDDWRARLGRGTRDSRHPVWIHAASAGETQAAAPLAAALAQTHPVRMTVFTASGRLRAAALVPAVPVELAPLDLPGAWRRFFERVEPRLAVVVETELWPNLLAAASTRNLPVVLASARLTPVVARRLARFPAATREMLTTFARVLVQTAEDLERFVALGLPRERAVVAGSLKEASTVAPKTLAHARTLRDGALAGRRVWVAGSVRSGEEAPVAEAVAAVAARVANAVALVVPRYPEQAREFAAALESRGIRAFGGDALDAVKPLPAGSAVVVDRLGVLQMLYAAADAAFVGGTLVPVGGHNLLEPAIVGVPVVVGSDLDNVRVAADRLKRAGALSVVRDAGGLALEIGSLLADTEAARAAGEAGRRAAQASTALEATLAELSPYLPEVSPNRTR